ncbi:MAG: 1-deoxy-D-xylulose-5-phosphate reductoisomerase, partial [Slackia sp.]|nr:1-deoxy-D-xylulose-5-phosphate reductoisomerase [Slackia sp.]
MSCKKRIAILGSTGSIGTQTADIVRRHPDKLEIVALAANRSVDAVAAQAAEFGVRRIAFGDEALAGSPALEALPEGAEVSFGPDALVDLVALDEVDCVVNALVGAAGMRASYETLRYGT